MPARLTQAEVLRYSRHLMIPEVGLTGQQRLKEASVLLFGCGGLGSPIALYLAAAGIGRIGLVDYDTVDISNLQRQVIHGNSSLGISKAESARQRIDDLNPHIQVDLYNRLLSAAEAEPIAKEYDVLIDGSDNFPTRYLLNDLAVLSGKPYVYGSVYRFEGQVSVFDARRGPCYRCMLPEPPNKNNILAHGNAGIFGIIPGIIGTIQAAETIKLLLEIGEPLIGKMLIFDALDMTFQTIRIKRNPDCKICGNSPQITSIDESDQNYRVPSLLDLSTSKIGGNVDAAQLEQMITSGTQLTLIDVREPIEQQISSLPGAICIPLERLPHRMMSLDPSATYVVYCRSGIRSAVAVDWMAEAGFTKVYNLLGGINDWARDIDQSLLQY